MIRVKICCISSREEASLAIKYGANALGLVSDMPSGPGIITEDTIRHISAVIPPAVSKFLLTSKQKVSDIINQQKKCATDTIQICDRITEGDYTQLKEALPGISIVQVVHVNGEESYEEAMKYSAVVDALLLDSGNQNLDIKELGGTGRTHNWLISRKIVDNAGVPVFLAGGINAQNLVEAVEQVNPFGVDLCSSVRTGGKLDEQKLKQFFEKVRSINCKMN